MKTVNTIATLSLLAFAGILSAGCATSQSDDNDEDVNVAVNDLQISPIEDAVQLRVGQLADGTFGVLEGAAGRSVAPGVVEIETDDGHRNQIIMGAEGHQWLVEQTAARLEVLRSQLDPGADAADDLQAQIASAEETMAAAQTALKDSSQSFIAPAVTCNVGMYTGPSGPITSPPLAGAAAIAQISCSGGCRSFTVGSQACCGGWCTPVNYASNTVCSALWSAGSIRQGSGSGAAQVYVAPVTQTNTSFFCY